MKPSRIRDFRRSLWWYPALLCTVFIAFVSFIGLVQPPFWFRVLLSTLFVIYVIVSFVRERGRTTRELERVHEMQSMAERLGRLGSWEYNIKTEEATYSSNLYELLGIRPGVVPFSDFIALVHPDDRLSVLAEREAVIAEKRSSTIEYRIVRPDGETRLMRAHAYPDANMGHLFGYLADITDIKPDEENQALLERMQAVSLLAGGLAHDFNNLLQVIISNLELIRQDAASEEQARLIDDVIATTVEAGGLVGRLREFAAPQAEEPPESIVVDDVIDELLSTLRRALPADLRLVTRLNASSIYVIGRRSALRQLLMNLVFNARDATDGAGEITLETQTLGRGNHSSDFRVHLEISDTGRGIDAATQRHIFEPFFSMKARGSQKGMGLGLAICYRVVADMGGSIEVESAVGKGATFHVYLPGRLRNNDEDGES